MPYDVNWDDAASDQLLELWLNAANRAAVTRASHRIYVVLAADPHQGQHQSEGLYRVIEPPLVAYYEIDEAKQEVWVSDVLAYRNPLA